LTLGVAYLTVLAHERNRQAQAQALRSQSRVLTSLLEPSALPPSRTRAELAREERISLVETAKDRWNEEVENAVRWVQKKNWTEVREDMESAVSKRLSGGLQKSRDGIEEAENQVTPKVQEAVDRVKAVAKKGIDKTAVGVDSAAAHVSSGVDRAIASTKQEFDQGRVKASEYQGVVRSKESAIAADAKSGAQEAADSLRNSAGTIDAARGAVRGIINKGIEKSKEAFGKTHAAIGLENETASAQIPTSSSSVNVSAVEKALHERYEKAEELKTVEETLNERYKPIYLRDNTVLRGV
jgi:altered-inheritance-of-mitochondria protein 5